MHKLILLAAVASWAGTPADMASFYPQWARYSVWTQAGPPSPSAETYRALNCLVQGKHKISPRDSINSIARVYGTDVRSLQSTNQNEFVVMRSGGYIRVMNKKGFLYESAREENLDSIVARYCKGGDKAALKRKIIDENRLPPSAMLGPYHLEKGEYLILPGVFVAVDGYHIPINGQWRISSGFGYRRHPLLRRRIKHQGIDLPKPYGAKVYPSRSGTVSFAGWEGGYGNMVEITHDNGEATRYGHLSRISVACGERVKKDKTLIGLVGDTGYTTGPHLHFEIRDRRGRPVNPYLRLGKG
ncbi:MAG: M23 family metallopeptidase [Elusimicrobiales bacterium]